MRLRLRSLQGRYSVARLDPDAPTPAWPSGELTSITRTPDELSIVCDEDAVPDGVQTERGWRALAVAGPIPFETTGVAAALTTVLAGAKISVFVMSTYDTDYLLVKDEAFARARDVLRDAGHEVD
jgi:hypothetical protein